MYKQLLTHFSKENRLHQAAFRNISRVLAKAKAHLDHADYLDKLILILEREKAEQLAAAAALHAQIQPTIEQAVSKYG